MEEQQEEIDLDQPRIASYCDSAIIRYTEYTINIEFDQQVPPEGKKKNNPVCLGRIVMSPQHAKTFHRILGDVIKEYEKAFNEILLKTE